MSSKTMQWQMVEWFAGAGESDMVGTARWLVVVLHFRT
jgi:hypothetical protein